MDNKKESWLWTDRKRYLGLPLSFTKYKLNHDHLIVDTGLLHLTRNNVKLFRVKDLRVEQPLFQRMLGCGFVVLYTSDASLPTVKIGPIFNPFRVGDLFDAAVEASRLRNHMRTTEFLDGSADMDGDGIPDNI
ncbi:MAG: PH domain-containing protein [Clostridia bacterium]